MKREDFFKLFDPLNINKDYKYCCDVQMDNSSTDEEVFKEYLKTFHLMKIIREYIQWVWDINSWKLVWLLMKTKI